MKKEAEMKVIFDNGGGKWLYWECDGEMYLHDYEYTGVEQLIKDVLMIERGHNPVAEGWDGNEIEDLRPIFDGESEDPSDHPLFPAEDENIGWWEV